MVAATVGLGGKTEGESQRGDAMTVTPCPGCGFNQDVSDETYSYWCSQCHNEISWSECWSCAAWTRVLSGTATFTCRACGASGPRRAPLVVQQRAAMKADQIANVGFQLSQLGSILMWGVLAAVLIFLAVSLSR